jgi:hypothetical protein
LSCLSSSVYILQSFIHFYIHASINSYITYILISFIQIAFRLSRLCLFSRIRVGVSFSPLSVSVISKKMYISFLHSPLSWFLVGEGCFSYFHFQFTDNQSCLFLSCVTQLSYPSHDSCVTPSFIDMINRWCLLSFLRYPVKLSFAW